MPELPDVTVYVEALARRVVGEPLERVRLASPFLLRSVEPPLTAAEGRRVVAVRRLGKRIVLELEGGLFLVLHLMIAGRLRWRGRGPDGPIKVPGKAGLAAFRAALARESHTLKRALTDPHLFSGIGNAFSDEILHRARLSPFKLTGSLTPEESERLYRAAGEVLLEWTERSRREVGEGFPEKVTAFRPGMAVHGRYRQPCPVCGAPVQHILYAENEANYCPRCQTGGKVLADRMLSRLLKDDWPRTLEELEARLGVRKM